jgi:hypothetical protein
MGIWRRVGMKGCSTVFNPRIFNLLQDFWPYGCVAFLVLFNALWAEVQELADAAGTLGFGRRHILIL